MPTFYYGGEPYTQIGVGYAWNAHRPYTVVCPVCGARPNNKCTGVPKDSVHAGRTSNLATGEQTTGDGVPVAAAILVICVGLAAFLASVLVYFSESGKSGFDDPSYSLAIGLSSLGTFLVIVGLLMGIWMYVAAIYRRGVQR